MPSSLPDYQKYLNPIRRRKELFLVLALLIMTAAFVTSYLLPRKYESSSTVFIEKNVLSELVRGITVTSPLDDTINVLTYAITSRSLIARVADSIDLLAVKKESEREALIKRLQGNITVKVKDKNLFTISFTDSDPKVARDFVNALVRTYIEDNISSKRGESYAASNFISDQIAAFSAKLEKAEDQVNAYKREKGGIIGLEESRIYQEIAAARSKLDDLQLRRRQLEGMRQISRTAEDPLRVKLAELQKRLDELMVQYTDSYPEVLQVKGEIETVKERLRKRRGAPQVPIDSVELGRINAEIAALRISEDGARRSIANNEALLREIPAAKAGLEKLEREKQSQKSMYDQLFARQGQSEVSRQLEVQDKSTTFRVVDPAVLPEKPSSPNRLKIMLLGIFGGLAGSFGLILLLEQLDSCVKDVEFVKGLGVPVLAIIPRMEDPARVIRQQRRSRCFFAAAGLYLLVMLCFPMLELLGLPYMDRLLDQVTSERALQGKTLSR